MKLRSWMAIASLFLISLSLVLVSVDRGNAIVIAQSQPSVCQETIYPVTDIDPSNISIGEVAIESGIARTGAHDDCKRVTPLPQGTRARIVSQTTGPDRFKKIVPWYQLDYGAWIEASALSILTAPVPTQATIASADVRADTAKTELVLPLSAPVPFEIQQNDRGFGITLYGIATGYGYCWRIQKPIEWAGRRVGQFVDESRLPLEQQLTNFARISIG